MGSGDTIEETEVPYWTSSRFGLSVIAFFGFINLYALRVNLSVAMVCMVNQTWMAEQTMLAAAEAAAARNLSDEMTTMGTTWAITNGNGSSDGEPVAIDTCSAMNSDGAAGGGMNGEFEWNKHTQGLVLGSFFWGYILTQIPGGWLAARYGGKRVYGYFMFLASAATLLMPVAARMHYILLIVLRVICGIGEGVVWPAMNSMWAYWAPPLERSKLAGFSYAGAQLGNVLTLPVAALLCDYGFDGGWPSIFYILGSCGVIWFVFWMFLTADTPDQHPRISKIEKEYIKQCLKGQARALDPNMKVPWGKFFRSGPVWAIILVHGLVSFGTYTFLTNMPTYMKEVLKFDIKSNGGFSALPYIGMWAIVNISGIIADYVRSRKILTTTNTRKLFTTLGQLIPGLSCVLLTFMDCTQPALAVALLTVGVASIGFQYGGGFLLNHVDIAPKYASILFGMSNTAATIPGFLVPIAIGALTQNQTQEEWRTVFFITAAIYVLGAIVYIILASGELQPWAVEQDIDHDLELKVTLQAKGEDDDDNKTPAA